MIESPEEQKRRRARERKRAERDRKRLRRQQLGAREFRMEMYRGTSADLACICTLGEFEEEAEAVTVLLRCVAQLVKRDPSRFKELINIRGLS